MKANSTHKLLILTVLLIGSCLTNIPFVEKSLTSDLTRSGSCGPQIFLDVLARYKDSSYPVEQHSVTTEDGHELTLFRI